MSSQCIRYTRITIPSLSNPDNSKLVNHVQGLILFTVFSFHGFCPCKSSLFFLNITATAVVPSLPNLVSRVECQLKDSPRTMNDRYLNSVCRLLQRQEPSASKEAKRCLHPDNQHTVTPLRLSSSLFFLLSLALSMTLSMPPRHVFLCQLFLSPWFSFRHPTTTPPVLCRVGLLLWA